MRISFIGSTPIPVEPGRPVILQVVGKRVDIAIEQEWNGRDRDAKWMEAKSL
jgi:hypothetical protein